ncbi:hypothetical protein [Micromonospora sp. KC721]|uniref:hypothetical protein n=1 Tax=Micromonospora sp. KC721 TaxID=2530380 RepID=UPI0010485598|nr:hypothetical protein [Micromonospora sp. KC721]TDB70009.1 hypothetical protein E1182_28345 [Micromonospora sp. KC721]
MRSTATPYYWQSSPSSIGDYHRAAEGQFREMSQIASGALDGNTTLVLLSAGGNDAGFPQHDDPVRPGELRHCQL